MDLLEHALRTYEEFMGVAFPKSDLVLLVADLEGFGGGEYAHGVIGSRWRSSADTIAHETAHLWNVTPHLAGTAHHLDIRRRCRISGLHLGESSPRHAAPGPEDSCSLANNIAELVRVEADPDVIFSSACNHTLGRGMFLALYDSMEDSAFRQGLRNLYLMSRRGRGVVVSFRRVRPHRCRVVPSEGGVLDRRASRAAGHCRRGHCSQILRHLTVSRLAAPVADPHGRLLWHLTRYTCVVTATPRDRTRRATA